MNISSSKRILLQSLLVVGAALCAAPLRADIKLASPFTSHMVLQRDMSLPVWGLAEAGEDVTVVFAGQKQTVQADKDGNWRVNLQPVAVSSVGQPLTVSGSKTSQPVTLDDVLVGEVWLASGQSNMVFPLQASGPYRGVLSQDGEIADANYPLIRMFTGADTKSYLPQANVKGTWVVCSPDTVTKFSAVGYLFARDLYRELKVPVGILTEASGASTAEAWISREAMTADLPIKPLLDTLDASYKFFKNAPDAPAVAPIRPTPINKPRGAAPATGDPSRDQHMPTVLFNGMINPVIPYAVRGAIWYQGESIVGGTPGLNLYGHVLGVLIADWRNRWGEGNFPFLVVQLPGQKNISNNPIIREQQQTVLALPNTGLAVTIDTGEANNVHPQNKAPVGYRLMCIALATAYGQNIEYSGPLYQSMEVKNNAAIIHFTHLGGGLQAKGGALKGFQIAGADKNFVDADAKIDGDTLVVSSSQVFSPVAVRYAWDDYPEGLGCNLYNTFGLPAAPFRTDTWDYPIPGIVEN
jgi:sialate O-acetylesterase